MPHDGPARVGLVTGVSSSRRLTLEAAALLETADVLLYDGPSRIAALNHRQEGAKLVYAPSGEPAPEAAGGAARQAAAWAQQGHTAVRVRGLAWGQAPAEDEEWRALAAEGTPLVHIAAGAVDDALPFGSPGPLAGCRILVTRARSQGAELSERLFALGGEPVAFPTIRFNPPPQWDGLDEGLRRAAAHYDWLIFTSVNGVRAFLERLAALRLDVRRWGQVRVAAVGPATAAALRAAGLQVDVVPGTYRGEAVVEAMAAADALLGRRVALVRPVKARDVIPDGLRRLGAHVDVLTAYETVPDGEGAPLVEALLDEGKLDVLTFTSPSTVTNFCRTVRSALDRVKRSGAMVVCIGPVTGEAAEKAGLSVHAMAEPYTVPGLVDAVVKVWQDGPRSGEAPMRKEEVDGDGGGNRAPDGAR